MNQNADRRMVTFAREKQNRRTCVVWSVSPKHRYIRQQLYKSHGKIFGHVIQPKMFIWSWTKKKKKSLEQVIHTTLGLLGSMSGPRRAEPGLRMQSLQLEN